MTLRRLRAAALSPALAAVIHACTGDRAAPIAPVQRPIPIPDATVSVTDSQPNYYAADVSMTISGSSLPHFTPTSPATVFTYRITKSRSSSAQPWNTRLQFSGIATGAIETDDIASYRRTYNAAGAEYTPTLTPLGRMSAGIPTSQDPVPAWPSLPAGITPLALAAPSEASGGRATSSVLADAAARPAARSLGGYVVNADDGQLALSSIKRPGVSLVSRRGDTATYSAPTADGTVEVSLSSSTGAELETVLREQGAVTVHTRHAYRELQRGVLARTGSVIDVTPSPSSGRRPAHIVYALSNILYERREVQ
jgi:hypothetical protein